MKTNRKPLNCTLRAVMAALLVCSMLSVQACDKDALKKFLESGDRITGIVNVARATLPVLKDEGLIDDAEQEDLTSYLNGITEPMEEFVSKARSYKEVTPDARDELGRAFAGVEAALDKFDAKGVLHLKNPKAQNRAKLWLSGMKVAARVIRSYLPERDQ